MTRSTRVPRLPRLDLPWIRNTINYPACYVGDRFLVAVPLADGGYDILILTMTEDHGFTPSDDWSWPDVEYYVTLDSTSPLKESEVVE